MRRPALIAAELALYDHVIRVALDPVGGPDLANLKALTELAREAGAVTRALERRAKSAPEPQLEPATVIPLRQRG